MIEKILNIDVTQELSVQKYCWRNKEKNKEKETNAYLMIFWNHQCIWKKKKSLPPKKGLKLLRESKILEIWSM